MNAKDKLKIILTGGHLSPLLSVIKKLEDKAEMVVIGRKYTFEADKTESLEYASIRKLGIPFYNLPSARLQRKITAHTLPSLLRFPKSFRRAQLILKQEKPDAILTFGGYIGLPVSLAASMLHIPVVLHEQTQKAGLSNKIIGKLAYKICISFESSRKYFDSSKTVLTGNPMRPEIFKAAKKYEVKLDKPLLCVMGGSTGSHRINMYIKEILPQLLNEFCVIHQTGDAQEYKDFDQLSKYKKSLDSKLQSRYMLTKYIDEDHIGWVYKHADMFVARSGANTVQELLVLSKKALLIPLSYAQGGEQLDNAKLYKESGLGKYVEETDIRSQTLYNEILSIYKSKVDSRALFFNDNAADKIVDTVLSSAQYEKKIV